MAKVVDALERSEVQVRYWEVQNIHSTARGRVEAGSRAAGDSLRSVHPSLRPACVCALPPENLHPHRTQSNQTPAEFNPGRICGLWQSSPLIHGPHLSHCSFIAFCLFK